MKIVFLTSTYYPNHNANSKCISKLAEGLVEAGHNVSIIGLSHSDGDIYYVNGCEVQRVIPLRTIVDRLFKGKLSDKYLSPLLKLARVFYIIRSLLSKNSFDYSKIYAFKKALLGVKDADIIVPVCFPFEGVVASIDFAKNNKVIVCPYLLDLFSVSETAHRIQFLKKIKMRSNILLEKNTLKQSKKIFVYNSWLEHVKKEHKEYSNKVVFLEHPLVDISLHSSENIGNIVFCGALSKKIRNPEVALNTISGFLFSSIARIRVDFYTTGDCDSIISKYDEINGYGSINTDNAIRVVKNAKYLLIIGNSDIRQLQSKVYECISTGKPIIFFYKSKLDPIYEILKMYGNCLFLDESEDQNMLIKKMSQFISSEYKVVDKDKISSLFRDCTGAYVAQKFIEVIEGK
ncbi:TPA: hypothetical protein I7730_23230 [Vibrio vulnificus]|uniref:Uncharacterized protein n=1 Tax=Vibrio vulnificus TaxID=672 RepID=A0A8H9N4M7_VIBVL|nr:hypothetical protein [Vibrio vulnificus]EMB7843714.1 hypothetical protein [Vibrio vulnificus]HAS8542704.1 hypothetical protein [Vibrio vulnificus]